MAVARSTGTFRGAHHAPEPYAQRLQAVRDVLRRREADAALIADAHDQFYLTGFTGEDGAVLITARSVWLITDGRFTEQAKQEAPWARALIRKGPVAEAVAGLARRLRITRLIVQPEATTLTAAASLRKALPKPLRLARGPGLIRKLRLVKDAQEVQRIRAAIRVGEQAFAALRRRIRPGMTEAELAARLEYEMRRRGASGAAFPTIVAVGPNAALPHARPGSRRVPKNGLILFDWGAVLDGYCGDLTRVLLIGRIPARVRKLYQVVLEAQVTAIQAIKPNASCRRIDRAARRVLDRAGFGRYFVHGLGHGLGLQVHEPPRLSRKSTERLAAGMVVTVEPGVYLPGVGGIRIEDDVLVTETGCEVLSRLDKRIEWAIIGR